MNQFKLGLRSRHAKFIRLTVLVERFSLILSAVLALVYGCNQPADSDAAEEAARKVEFSDRR